MRPEDFLTADQQKTVVDAVRFAEKYTSGEIRIHIDGDCDIDPVRRAEEVFDKLHMNRTKLRNGVLIYIACNSKVFAIIGDKGIDRAVPEHFWEDVIEAMSDEFHSGRFAEGISKAVIMTGEKLRDFFPYQNDDVNEQPDEISFGRQN